MADRVLPSRDAVDEALTFAPLTDIAEDSIFDIARAYVSGRLVDRKALRPCHVRRTLHQTDYPCNRHQHYWIPDDAG